MFAEGAGLGGDRLEGVDSRMNQSGEEFFRQFSQMI
jgi:hypothetical protein